jgi:hypothetical protein
MAYGGMARPDGHHRQFAEHRLRAWRRQGYVSRGIIDTDAMREGTINQLIEEGVYPGFEDAISDNRDGVPDEPAAPAPGGPVDPKTGLPFPGPQGGPRPPGLPPGRGVGG